MTKTYFVRSNLNPKMVLCTDGEFRHEMHVGIGTQFAVKLYKTERGAKAVRNGAVTVEAVS